MISRFHYLTQDMSSCSHMQLVQWACEGGARWVQLRIKDPTPSSSGLLRIAKEVQQICNQYNARLIINDYVGLAKEIGAHGVHLGKQDLSPEEARKILGPACIIGSTANTPQDIYLLRNKPVDYIGIGPYRFTHTKKNLSPLLGLNGIQQLVKYAKEIGCSLPLIAIGGIQLADIESLSQIGVYGIAVASAINTADRPIEMTKKFIKEINRCFDPLVP